MSPARTSTRNVHPTPESAGASPDLEDRLDVALAAGDREDQARAIWELLTPEQRELVHTLAVSLDAGNTRGLALGRREANPLRAAGLLSVRGRCREGVKWFDICRATDLGRAVAEAGADLTATKDRTQKGGR